MTSTDEILSKLNKKTAEAVIRASQSHNDRLLTPSVGINKTTGGIGRGRQTMIWGNRSAGKTLFMLQQVALAQASGLSVAWIDAERQYDKDWASRFGVDSDNLILSQVTSIAEFADQGVELVRAGVDLMVVDSVSSLLPQSYFDDGEMKDFAKTGQIGTYSKNLTSACNMLNSVNQNTALVLISQVRNEFGAMHASLKPMGGKGVDHLNSTSIKLWSSMAASEQIEGKVSEGDIILKKPVGRKVKWFIDKARGPGMGEEGEYVLYFKGDRVGIDRASEVLNLGVLYGVIKKGGAWYTMYGHQEQGGESAAKYLRENPEIMEKVVAEIG